MFNELNIPGRVLQSVPVAHSLVALAALSFAPLSVHADHHRQLYLYTGSINNSGTVAGSVLVITSFPQYVYSNYGFIRAADGTVSTFEIPGATSLDVGGINSNGTIVGGYFDGYGHGFVRAPNGAITTFQVPGGYLTHPNSISANGDVAGSYFVDGSVKRGFIRAKNGTITTFSAGDDTQVLGINASGDVTGYATLGRELDPEKVFGFVRTAQGKITTFEFSEANYTLGCAINTSGAVIGSTLAAPGGGFLREPDGTLTFLGVYGVSAINSQGTITGSDRDETGMWHGYTRSRDGTLQFFDVPGATTGLNGGTYVTDINSAGTITGFYSVGEDRHGFVRSADGTITTFGIPELVSAAQAPAIEDRALIEQPVAEQGSTRASIRAASLLRHGAAAELEFSLPEAAQVSLVVYDVMGRCVATIEHGHRNAGVHRASWDATATGPGIYFYRLVAGSQTATRSVRVVP